MAGSGYVVLARQVLGRARSRIAPGYYKLHERAARVLRHNSRTILESHEGADPNRQSARVAVLVHFDGRGLIDGYVQTYVENLRAAGFRIWLMSNSPRLKPEALSLIKPHVTWIHRRNNFGFDFGAYKDGVASVLQATSPEQLLLCNDSVYGPFVPLERVLEKATAKQADIWGATESYEKLYHLQSFFLLFHRRAIEHPGFIQYWRDAPYVDARGWLIHHGELGLTQAMLKAGLNTRALFPTEAIAAALQRRVEALDEMIERDETPPVLERKYHDFRSGLLGHINAGLPLNPTHFFWDILISDLGFPFIKRDLLQFNPVHIPNVAEWRQVIEGISSYDVDLIRRHLITRLKNRAI